MLGDDDDPCDEAAQLKAPLLLVYADHDSISPRHGSEFLARRGRDVREPGWIDTTFTEPRLATLHGYSRYNRMAAGARPSIVEHFLATEPPTRPGAGAAQASQASPGSRA